MDAGADTTNADASPPDTAPPADTAAPAPKLVVVPPTLDYGAMALGSKATRSFRLFNQGDAPLKVSAVAVSVLSQVKTLTVSHPGPFTVGAGENQLVDVELVASAALPNDGSAVASLVVSSDDPKLKQLHIPVLAKPQTGSLKVTPPGLLDFAIVGKGVTVERKVELFNQGMGDVEVKSVVITDDSDGEFALVPGSFAPVSASPTPYVMKAAEYQSFRVKFTATGTVGAQAKGKLLIKSDDPDLPERTITLVADRAEGTVCNIKILPGVANFGVLTYGQSKTMTLTVENVGSGYCSFVEQKVLDCPASGIPPIPGPPSCALKGAPPFATFAPATKLFSLGPGESAGLPVQFTAPASGGLFNDPKVLEESFGYLALRFKDQATGLSAWYPKDPTKSPAKLSPNLIASVGATNVTVLPKAIEFGEVSLGCKGQVAQAEIYNTGITPVFITALTLQGCGSEVKPVAWPSVPKSGVEISQSTPVKLGLQFAPLQADKATCQLVVTTGNEGQCVDAAGTPTASGPCKVSADCLGAQDALCSGQSFTVPLSGKGTTDKERTDVFEQGGKKVDVLFVVDSSSTMGPAQGKLIAGLSGFIKLATQMNADYHMGVITMDMVSPAEKGRLRTHTDGTRIVTPSTPNAAATLAALANVGIYGSAAEHGLVAAKVALSLPLSFDSGNPCQVDSDCSDGGCVAGPQGKKACGGHNRGFLRKDAGLEIIFLSDEDDTSPGAIAYYVNFLHSIKGFDNKGQVRAHAIVGTKGGGLCALPSTRFLSVAKDTGGTATSVCDASFTAALDAIGKTAFDDDLRYQLTMTPQPATISVSVDGTACVGGPKGRTYDASSNSVVLLSKLKGGTCEPKKGAKVMIKYKALCLP